MGEAWPRVCSTVNIGHAQARLPKSRRYNRSLPHTARLTRTRVKLTGVAHLMANTMDTEVISPYQKQDICMYAH